MENPKVYFTRLGNSLYVNIETDVDVNKIMLALNKKYTVEIKSDGTATTREYAALDDISPLVVSAKNVSPFNLLAYLQNPTRNTRPTLAMLQNMGLDEKSLNALRTAVQRKYTVKRQTVKNRGRKAKFTVLLKGNARRGHK